MVFLKKILNVKKIIIERKNVYYQSDNNIIKNEEVQFVLDNDFFGEFYVNNGVVVIQNFLGYFEVKNKKINGYYNYLDNNTLSFWDKEDKHVCLLRNENIEKTVFTKPFYGLKKTYIIEEDSKINVYNYSFEFLWQYSLLNHGVFLDEMQEKCHYKIKKILGLWNQDLLVACSNGLILSLDIEKGTLKHQWQSLEGAYEFLPNYSKKLPEKTECFSLLNEENKLVGAWVYSYFEIDLATNEIIHYYLKDELEIHNITSFKNVNNNPITDTHIYITASMNMKENHKGFTYDCLIALNRKTHKIDWKYIFEEEGLGINIPKLKENKLYQLDNGDTLHIFEK